MGIFDAYYESAARAKEAKGENAWLERYAANSIRERVAKGEEERREYENKRERELERLCNPHISIDYVKSNAIAENNRLKEAAERQKALIATDLSKFNIELSKLGNNHALSDQQAYNICNMWNALRDRVNSDIQYNYEYRLKLLFCDSGFLIPEIRSKILQRARQKADDKRKKTAEKKERANAIAAEEKANATSNAKFWNKVKAVLATLGNR
jgi:hypothetical protein